LSYDGWTYTWENGRQLKSLSNASTSLSFKYNSDGIRTEKTVNGVTTKYTVFGDKVSFETTGSDKIHYSYDASGNLFTMNLNGTEYYYVRNAQGDITGLIDNAGNLVVSYTYDTWGKLISTTGSLAGTVGVKNPYRYRGYRYDNETGLYYLQSRYYNPDWGRFVNADGLTGLNGKLLGHNMFAYCVNNPVNNYDPSGFLHMESAGFSTLTVPHTVQSNKSVRSVRPNTSVAIPVAIGVGLESLGNVSRTIAGIVGADRVLHIIPKTSIPQTYTPFLASAKTAAKIVLVVTTFAELSGTWDPMVKMSNSQRLEKSAIQVGGTLVALGVGALVSAPIIAAGFAGGTVSIIIGIGAGFVVDYAVANAIGNIQKEIYNARGYE
jgi:RHS repeat-associated protein